MDTSADGGINLRCS